METTELRLGNFVKSENFDISRIVGLSAVVTLDRIEYVHVAIPDNEFGLWNNGKVEPIELTEEWLLKFGFEKNDIDDCFISPIGEIMQIDLTAGQIDFIWDGAYSNAPCEFVHQLQNLFFAITGTELEIKN